MTKPSKDGSPEHGPERSAFAKAAVSLSCIFVPGNRIAQSGSGGFPRNADLAEQLNRLAAALPAAVSFDASHVLDTSGRFAATCAMQKSTWSSQAVAELPHSPAFAKAGVYFDSTLATQSLSPEESPVFVTFARHANLPLWFFPIAFSFPATHLSQSGNSDAHGLLGLDWRAEV
jgi:hypothetical protein